MMSAKEWDNYLRFLRSIGVAQVKAGNGLQEIPEAAFKASQRQPSTCQPEVLQAAHTAATIGELPPMPLPSDGKSLLTLDVVYSQCVRAHTPIALGALASRWRCGGRCRRGLEEAAVQADKYHRIG